MHHHSNKTMNFRERERETIRVIHSTHKVNALDM